MQDQPEDVDQPIPGVDMVKMQDAWHTIARAFQLWLEHTWSEMRPVLAQLAEIGQGLADGTITLAEDVPGCHCLCGVHKAEGMFCLGSSELLVTMIGGPLDPIDVHMCGPCAHWWQEHKPERVAGVKALLATA